MIATSQGAEALAGGSDALVKAGKQGRKAILLLGDSRSGGIGSGRLPRLAASRIQSSSGRIRSVERISRSAPASASPIAIESWSFTSSVRRPTWFCKGLGTLGEGLDRAVLCARLFRKLLQLAASPADRLGECRGALVARFGKAGEMLVELRQGPGCLGHDPLRRALLLGDPRSQAVERDIGGRDIGRERFCSFRAGPADAGRGLLDERGDGRGLRVDAGADLLERSGGTASSGGRWCSASANWRP